MSKAFTKEGDEPVVPVRPRPPGEPRPITWEGYRRLEKRLRELEAERAALADDKALDARTRRADLEASADQLAAVLREVIPQAVVPDGKGRAVFGSRVQVEDENGALHSYQLVGPDEADLKEGHLSVSSPLARALLGRVAGESVTVARPRGDVELTLVSVE